MRRRYVVDCRYIDRHRDGLAHECWLLRQPEGHVKRGVRGSDLVGLRYEHEVVARLVVLKDVSRGGDLDCIVELAGGVIYPRVQTRDSVRWEYRPSLGARAG